MNVTSDQVKAILTGNHMFSQLGFSMLITRLKRVYAIDTSLTGLQNCTDEINAFLKKYGPIMSNDYAIISKL